LERYLLSARSPTLAEPLDRHIAAIVVLEQFRDLSPHAESMQSDDDKDDDDNSEEQHPR
jgi:hypothetical protein